MPTQREVPPVDAALARRVEEPDAEYVVARLEWLARRPGNPAGASVHRLDGMTVLRARAVRSTMFNRVLLADDGAVARLDEALAVAGGSGAGLRFDVLPPLPSGRLMQALTRRRFACAAHFTGLYAPAAAVVAPGRLGGVVRPMRPAEMDAWIDVYLRSFGIAGPDAGPMGESLRGLPGRDECVLLVAEISGSLAAITALWISAGTGYVALCATLPQARGLGAQSALIATCARIAEERGCDLVAAHTAVGSQSQRNFERCGLRIAFHKGIWTRPAAGPPSGPRRVMPEPASSRPYHPGHGAAVVGGGTMIERGRAVETRANRGWPIWRTAAGEDPATIRAGTATSRGFRISFEDAGRGAPAIVLIPGFTMLAADWREMGYTQRLARSHRVLSVDPLGHGLSDKPTEAGSYRWPDVGDDVVAAMDAAGVDRAVLWGYSRGAALAATIAVRHPDRVAGVILGGENVLASPPSEWPDDDWAVRLWGGSWDALHEVMGTTPEDAAFEAATLDPRAFGAAILGGRASRGAIDVGRISAPALVYGGDEDNVEALRAVAAAMGVGVHIVAGADHVAGFTASDRVIPFVEEFLADPALATGGSPA